MKRKKKIKGDYPSAANGKNVPFEGDTKSVSGSIISPFDNRRKRRVHFNAIPNSIKVSSKGRGKGVSAPIRSIKQLLSI